MLTSFKSTSPLHVRSPGRLVGGGIHIKSDPLQSWSIPSPQISAPGALGVQVCGTPFPQALTVRAQAPTPHDSVPKPSSTCPSQLLSIPSHTSGEGVSGVQVCRTPLPQALTVRTQAPT